MSLKEIMNIDIKNPKNEHENLWKIPTCKPVEYTEKEHFINPYLLGILIGDGNLCNNGVNISIPDNEIETVNRIKEIIGENYVLVENRSATCPRYKITEIKQSLSSNPFSSSVLFTSLIFLEINNS